MQKNIEIIFKGVFCLCRFFCYAFKKALQLYKHIPLKKGIIFPRLLMTFGPQGTTYLYTTELAITCGFRIRSFSAKNKITLNIIV